MLGFLYVAAGRPKPPEMHIADEHYISEELIYHLLSLCFQLRPDTALRGAIKLNAARFRRRVITGTRWKFRHS